MDAFWAKVDKKGPIHPELKTPCWTWGGGRNNCGYGRVNIAGKQQLAHRVAWTLENGAIPEGMHVLHRCDNPPCCNPAHLFLGTHRENMHDRDRKGRHWSKRHKKKTPPTTVRFTPENHAFVKAQAEFHPDGQSGVINDAMTFYRRHVQKRPDVIYSAIAGANEHGEAQDT